jgi:DNA polymerase III subunit epsilon
MREIVLDTETTALDPTEGHRIVEIGAVELINRSTARQPATRFIATFARNALCQPTRSRCTA